DVGALPLPPAPAAGYLLRVRTVDNDTGELTTEAVPESSLSSFVRRTDRPTAQQAGPVKLAGGYGLALTADGALRLVPATQAQLDAMTEAWAPSLRPWSPWPSSGPWPPPGTVPPGPTATAPRPGPPWARRRPPPWRPSPPGWKLWTWEGARRSPSTHLRPTSGAWPT